MKQSILMTASISGLAALMLTACGTQEVAEPTPAATPAPASTVSSIPAELFDLSHWNITVPVDANNDDKVDIVKIADIQTYSHPDFFYADPNGHMVFTAPNKALTTPNSSNTRSELRYMSRGSNTKIKTSGTKNNFALASHPKSAEYDWTNSFH